MIIKMSLTCQQLIRLLQLVSDREQNQLSETRLKKLLPNLSLRLRDREKGGFQPLYAIQAIKVGEGSTFDVSIEVPTSIRVEDLQPAYIEVPIPPALVAELLAAIQGT